MVYYLPMFLETSYVTLYKGCLQESGGILLTYVMLYFNKGWLQESGWYIILYFNKGFLEESGWYITYLCY